MFSRISGFVYGVVCYLAFLAAFLYAIGFIGNFGVPQSIDSAPQTSVTFALVIDVLLLGLFAVQHSVMARPQFKRWWTRLVPAAIERSTYVLLTSLALVLLFWQWRPLPAVLWQIDNPPIALAMTGISLAGWLIVLTSSFLINHFELFGLQQVTVHLVGRTMPEPRFRTPVLYRLVRHPLYLGLVIAFWATPVMTAGHLLFAAITTAYIFVGIFLEERDLTAQFGDEYRRYRQRVAMLIPLWRRS